MAILQKQVVDLEAKCKKLEADLATIDKAWRLERLQLKVAENLARKETDTVKKELDAVLKKKDFEETEAQKLVHGLEERLLQSQNQTEEAKAKVAKLEVELVNANKMVSISNSASGMIELKRLLEEQQKLHKTKDDQISKLENQVRILDANNEDLTAQLNKDQFYDANGDDDDVTEVQAPILAIQDVVSTNLA